MRSPAAVLLRDELVGFARSRVMLVMWIVVPLLVTGLFVLISNLPSVGKTPSGKPWPVMDFMGFVLSSLVGTIAALMVAVDLVSERQRKVYQLFVIRPVRREAILLTKFIAVFACVTIACVVSFALAITVDTVRGHPVTMALLGKTVRSFGWLTATIALSGAIGVFFGVVSRTIVIAVVFIIYVGQNLTYLPMLPGFLGVLPEYASLFALATVLLTGFLLWGSAALFRRAEL